MVTSALGVEIPIALWRLHMAGVAIERTRPKRLDPVDYRSLPVGSFKSE